MDIEIHVKTPGNTISLNTMLHRIAEDLTKDVERGTLDMLKKEYPNISNTILSSYIINASDIYLDDAKKGSWEFNLLLALGGLIGKAFYDLGMDAVKTSSWWENFKKSLSSPSKDAAGYIAERMKSRKHLGPYKVTSVTTSIKENKKGISKLRADFILELKREITKTTTYEPSEQQYEDLIRQIEDRGDG